MKKVLQILAAVIVSVGFVGAFSTAHAVDVQGPADECENVVIVNSGSGNTTTFKCADELNLEVVCTNNVYVLNASSQAALSGAATVTGNQSGGNAVSGTVENSNDTTTHVVGSGCGSETTTPVTPTTPTTPVTPTTAAPKQKVAVLPYTASNSVAETALIAVAVAAVVAIASRIAVVAYRRVSLK